MCAIVDANVAGEIFGDNPSPAGRFFFDWLNTKGRLAVGGELTKELATHHHFVRWLRTAVRNGRAAEFPDWPVGSEAESLRLQGACQSNDWHVLGLARVSGARLLFSNDRALQQDFRNREIVGGRTRGQVYTTLVNKDVRRSHRSLLNRTDLCEI